METKTTQMRKRGRPKTPKPYWLIPQSLLANTTIILSQGIYWEVIELLRRGKSLLELFNSHETEVEYRIHALMAEFDLKTAAKKTILYFILNSNHPAFILTHPDFNYERLAFEVQAPIDRLAAQIGQQVFDKLL